MATPSSSYSSLLRRSKLATYHPQIDQVYTTTSANLSRQNFGLKRPLPAATTRTAPFVRVSQLDSNERRTVFRKATREQSYVKRWQETGVGLQSEAFSTIKQRKWDLPQVQSRFVPASLADAVTGTRGGGKILGPDEAPDAPTRTPNFLAMSEPEFEAYLDRLGTARDEFKRFVADEHAKMSGTAPDHADFDLFAHAQSNPNDLVRLVERFLRAVSPSQPEKPLPQVHPTLALQYATPTPLESALAAPIPGRILGPSPVNSFNRPSGPLSSFKHGAGPDLYASVLSTVSPVSRHQHQSGSPVATTQTTFYPDAQGVRSNVPGRHHFKLVNPTINPVGYANRIAIVESGLRRTPDFRPATAEYEPSLLALRPVAVNPVVVDSSSSSGSGRHNTPATRHAIGSPAYSGALPPELNSRGFDRFGTRRTSPSSGGGPGGATPQGLSAYFGGGQSSDSTSYKSLGVNERGPRDLVAGRKKKRTKEEHERWLQTRESLMNDREYDDRRQQGRQQQQRAKKGSNAVRGGGKDGKKEQLLERLSELLK